jgi:SAM-dependent methyltransferase
MNLPGIPGRVHPNDFMLKSTDGADLRDYRRSATDTLAVLDQALAQAGSSREEVGHWLDFGCGYGRVLRFLLQRVPAERVWVTDLLPEAVRFCSRQFNVNPVYDLSQRADLLGTFDLIYAISVFTHVPPAEADALANMLASVLAPGGMLIFTVHGPSSLDASWRYPNEFVGKRARPRRQLEGCRNEYDGYILCVGLSGYVNSPLSPAGYWQP